MLTRCPRACTFCPGPGLKRVAGECALLEGNKEGWITCCSQRFFPLAKRISGDDSLAEDALQVSWIKILQAVNHTCFNGPKACPWVSTIIANSAKDVRRQRFRRVEVRLSEVEDPGQTPEAAAQEKQLLALLREMISLLPDTYRQVVNLRLYQGLSLARRHNAFMSPARMSRLG